MRLIDVQILFNVRENLIWLQELLKLAPKNEMIRVQHQQFLSLSLLQISVNIYSMSGSMKPDTSKCEALALACHLWFKLAVLSYYIMHDSALISRSCCVF